jgi:adenylyl-sulfate kinase
VWLTGLPAAGKTTLSSALAHEMNDAGCAVTVFDGDRVRAALAPALGYSRADRHRNVVRVARMAVEALTRGEYVLVALVSPYRDARAEARTIVEAGGHEFIEVYVDASAQTCIERDPKGLYAKALAGEITDFTGVDGVYEAPEAPEVRVNTEQMDSTEATARILAYVEGRDRSLADRLRT